MTALVLDASVVAGWLFSENEASGEVLARMGEQPAAIPSLWPYEVANAILSAKRAGRITSAEASEAWRLVRSLPVRIDGSSLDDGAGPTWQLAEQHGLTAYDACYLALALREGGALATYDRALRRAAKEEGVDVVP